MNNLFRIVAILLLLLPFQVTKAEDGYLNVALLGDSMTWIGGDNFEKPHGWTHYITDLPLNLRTYARSGATWTNTRQTKADTKAYSELLDPQNVIYNQALRLIDDRNFQPDVIIIYAGTNDAWFSAKRPGIFDNFTPPDGKPAPAFKPSDFTSLEGSIWLVNSLLRENFPEARLYLVTPTKSGKISDESISRVSEIIETAGAETGASVVRGDALFGFSHKDEVAKPFRFTYDGVHTNEKGARRIADCIKSNILLPELVSINNRQ